MKPVDVGRVLGIEGGKAEGISQGVEG